MWDETSSLQVRATAHVLQREITGKGEVSLWYNWFPPIQSSLHFFQTEKYFIACFISKYYSQKALPIRLLPMCTEHLCLSQLSKTRWKVLGVSQGFSSSYYY